MCVKKEIMELIDGEFDIIYTDEDCAALEEVVDKIIKLVFASICKTLKDHSACKQEYLPMNDKPQLKGGL